MTKKGSKNIEEPCSCDDKTCCQPQSSQKPEGIKKWWKIGVFSLGVILIIGATTYSLITRQTGASNTVDTSAIPQINTSSCGNALTSLGVNDLIWAQDLNSIFIDHDIVFVILPDSDAATNSTLTTRISDATAKIEDRGDRVGTFTLGATDPEFSTTMQRLALAQLPAVIILSYTGNGAIVTGDITEGKLLQTYVTVSQPVCAPGSVSGCCPK
ncbi:MAG TPA: hypothetical protein VF366_07970 [Dehalococcoidia bacterium]|jgi:hypothetical protein